VFHMPVHEDKVWLSTDILNWHARADGGTQYEEALVRAPYRHWEHADQLCKCASKELQLVDVVSALKRAIDFRIKRLNELYQFKRAPFLSKNTGAIDFLAQVGALRPMMLEKLLSIRNKIEHQDKNPPKLNECLELTDFTWYFLRSTDQLVRVVHDGYVLDPTEGFYETPYAITLKTGPRNDWDITVTGWVPGAWISAAPKEEWFQVKCTACEGPENIISRLSRKKQEMEILDTVREITLLQHSRRDKSDVWLIGRATAPAAIVQSVVARYFQVS
jgi:hypothetical protein